ncbi:MAG: DUF3987 domain-containing protein [Prevotellaceae bacterium]|nr:DUF3987 domain-containing protein [Candidatus Minthosoma caballi]
MAKEEIKKIAEVQTSEVTAKTAGDLGNLKEMGQNTETGNNVSREVELLYRKTYHGFTISALVQAMIESNGLETEGGEAIKTAKTLAEQIRIPLLYDADSIYAIIDQFVVVDNKELLAEICKNAVKTSNLKYGNKLLDKAVRTLVLEEKANNKAKGDIAEKYGVNPNLIPIPRLPKLLKDILDCYPKEFHHAVLSVAVACLAFHAENVWAVYNETELYRLLFIDAVLADAAGGKSFLDRINAVINKDIIAESKLGYAEEDAIKNAAASGKKKRGRKKIDAENAEEAEGDKLKEKKVRPIQYVGSTTSITELFYRALHSEGHPLFMFTNEGAEFFLSCKRGPNTDTWTFMRKGVEGSEYVQSHHSVDTVSGICNPFLSAVQCVQPEIAIPEFSKHIVDGTTSRIWFSTVEQMAGGKRPRIKPFSAELLAEIDEIVASLKTLNEKIELRRLHKVIDHWLDDKALEYEQTDNLAIDHFRKRAAQIAYKAGVFCYLINGRKENKNLCDFALYVAEYVLRQQVRFFGEDYNRLKNTKMDSAGINNVNYYSMLPDVFSASQFSALRAKHGDPTNVRTIIWRWHTHKPNPLVEEIEPCVYRKLI